MDTKVDKENLQRLIHTVVSIQLGSNFKPPITICPQAVKKLPEVSIPMFYGIDNSVKCQITFDNLNGPPGKVKKVGPVSYEIIIDPVYRYPSIIRAAILAHEYAHIWLDLHWPNRESANESERLADVTAVFPGGGLIILKAMQEYYDYKTDSVTHKTRRLGYLSLREFCCALDVQSLWIENPVYLGDLKCIPAIVKEAFKTIIGETDANPRLISFCDHSLIVQCNNCFQRLRIPRSKIIKIRCPLCKTEYIVEEKRNGRFEFKRVSH